MASDVALYSTPDPTGVGTQSCVLSFMYVNAQFGGQGCGGSTCESAPPVAWPREVGRAAGAGVTHPLAVRYGAGRGGGAERGVRAATEGTFRKDFSKELCEGTFEETFTKGSNLQAGF